METIVESLKLWRNQGALLLVFISVCIVTWRRFRKEKQKEPTEKEVSQLYKEIEPLENFNWKDEEHVKLRAFKPTYHLTMGIQNTTMSDWVLMDKTYHDKIMLRRGLVEKHEKDVIGFNPVARDAVFELYTYLFETYLPKRFPSMFVVQNVDNDKEIQKQTMNIVFGDVIPLEPLPSDPNECLAIIARHVDGEFAILLPEWDPNAKPFRATPATEFKQVYHLHAFVLLFPSGFNTPQKLGLPLAAIHGPVPGYRAKLEKSMDRFFASLPFGKMIWRSNWSISTDGVHFNLSGNHYDIRKDKDEEPSKNGTINVEMAPPTYEATAEEIAEWNEASKKVDPENCYLRMERQTLHRLEKTGALVFGFKTFMEPLSELKEEGNGPLLAAALEGMRLGNVPAMDVYKNGVIWREPLRKYLTT